MVEELNDDLRKRLEGLFENSIPRIIGFRSDNNVWHISFSQRDGYDGSLDFKDNLSLLRGMMLVAKILGCRDGDEESRYQLGGCSTCGNGSTDVWEWRFW